MGMSAVLSALRAGTGASQRQPVLVIGITHSQTCLVLSGRLRALREAGFRIVLISSPGKLLLHMAVQEGIETVTIPMHRGISPFKDLLSFLRLLRALHHLRPDITEFSTPKAGLLGSIAALLCRVPVRIYLLRGLKLETSRGLMRPILRVSEWLSALCSHHVLCNSKSLLTQALQLGIAPTSKLCLLGNGSSHGVDVDHFVPASAEMRASLRAEHGLNPDAPVIGFVGRLTRDKGVPELIEAFDTLLQDHSDARLLLVGWFDHSEDAVEPRLRHYIDMHPSITCTGFVPDTAPWYRVMDMMVLPSWREGFPNVALEAAASGIPVITTLVTGSRDAVVPEVTGLLIPPGYPEAINEAMLTLLRDEHRRQAMGYAARKWGSEHFTEKHVLDHTVNLYRSLLSNPDFAPAALTKDTMPIETE